jgi:predicted TIM-barrel fold metal-dependent hydrolase
LKIIDAHLHFSEREHFRRTAETVAEVAFSAKGLRSEYEIAGVTAGIVMTSPGREPLPSSGYSRELELKDGSIENLLACIGVNPVDLSNDPGEELYLIEKELNMPYATGIKLYPGYFPFYVTDPLYKPIYRLAQKYKMPVAIHCGDTSSARAKLKYSHPMTVDEAAVEYPDITFVICHMGDPWVMDTAELISKNPNVYTDVSGMIAGNAAFIQRRRNTALYMDHFRQAMVYAEQYDKILFGTDWPIAPVVPYVEFIKDLVPEEHHQDVFFNNALKVYPKLKDLFDSSGS